MICMLIGMEATTAIKKFKPRSKMNIITNYSLQINTRNELVISAAGKADMVLGLAYGVRIHEMHPTTAAAVRKAGANPADYFAVNGKPVRNSVRAEAERLMAEARAAYADSPAGLRAARTTLTERIRCASGAAADTRTENFHRYDTGAGMGRNGYDAKAEAARAELIAFDAAHPEIKAGIEAEKTESVARNFWN
jgi:hypothetical protein